MSTAIGTDEDRIHDAAEEMFELVKDSLPPVLIDEVAVLLYVGEEDQAIDFMKPYFQEEAAELSAVSALAIKELHTCFKA